MIFLISYVAHVHITHAYTFNKLRKQYIQQQGTFNSLTEHKI
jgi:hypothetical protein